MKIKRVGALSCDNVARAKSNPQSESVRDALADVRFPRKPLGAGGLRLL
jgi:hypothetical protein